MPFASVPLASDSYTWTEGQRGEGKKGSFGGKRSTEEVSTNPLPLPFPLSLSLTDIRFSHTD